MGDGQIFTTKITNTDSKPAFNFVHIYNISVANIQITFNVSNLVSNISLVSNIVMQENITSGQLTFKNVRILVGDTAIMQLAVDIRSQAFAIVDFGDRFTQTLTILSSAALSHVYTNAGNYSIAAFVFNNVSHVNITSKNVLMVMNNLNSLVIQTPNMVALPAGNFTVSFSSPVTYWGITCRMNVGAISTAVTFPLISAGDVKQQSLNVSKLSLLDQPVYVACSNELSNTSYTSKLVMVRSIGILSMNVSVNITQVGDFFDVLLEVTTGSNITFVVSYGDGNLDLQFSGNATSHSFRKSYSTPGIFMIRGSAVNALSSSSCSAIIYSIEALKDVSFNHYSIDLYSGRTYSGTGSELNLYNLDRQLVVSANVTNHDNLKYFWQFQQHSNMDIVQTLVPLCAKKFYNPGHVTIRCMVTNGVTNISDSFHVEIQSPVSLTYLVNDGPQKARNKVNFSLGIANPTDTTCVLLNLQSQTILTGASICQVIALDQSFEKMYNFTESKITKEINFQQHYESEGSYSVQTTVFNWVSRSFAVSQVSFMSSLLKGQCFTVD